MGPPLYTFCSANLPTLDFCLIFFYTATVYSLYVLYGIQSNSHPPRYTVYIQPLNFYNIYLQIFQLKNTFMYIFSYGSEVGNLRGVCVIRSWDDVYTIDSRICAFDYAIILVPSHEKLFRKRSPCQSHNGKRSDEDVLLVSLRLRFSTICLLYTSRCV